MKKKIFYAAGPGDVVETFRYWLKGVDDPSQYAVTYSSQFFDLVRQRRWEAMVVSSNHRSDNESVGGISVINRPPQNIWGLNSFIKGKGAWWLGQIGAGFRILSSLLKFRPDYAVISEGTAPWLFLIPARIYGITIIPALHCTLWPTKKNPNPIRRKFGQLAFRLAVKDCVCVSHEIARQVQQLAGNSVACHVFYPTYRPEQFKMFLPVDWSIRPIRILYLGRIEKDKGVFDLLDSFFQILRGGTFDSFALVFCGSGSSIGLLKERTEERELSDKVLFYGHQNRRELEKQIAAAHIIVVPTTSDFVEGFNKTVAEGVLSKRPVVATSVCPSATLFGNAVTLVPPDDPNALASAILSITRQANSPKPD